MAARTVVACFALLAVLAGNAFAQDAVIIVDVKNRTRPTHSRQVALEDHQSSIASQLQATKIDALQLYTDFASRAGNDLKTFLTNITGFADGVIRDLNERPPYDDVNECWKKFEFRVKKIEHDARRAAVYSGDCHHKFLLGHMIVFRMHLNKSEDYLKRCDKVNRGCNRPCEYTPRVRRWQRLAQSEIRRVREDMPFTRRSYRDLVSHARRKLNHLKKQAIAKSTEAVEDYKYCIYRG
ncbi:hypothetical protein PYW08_016131 [Mythimna loreyi]|uniref:Uncharacterized protein n=1 Tax=Mythimna loreyi TaxID=667449 RepID=A0ACC2QSK1_9NEOP|nr:hypothetical protein PYW08_016131 [Mythimna loreyi]